MPHEFCGNRTVAAATNGPKFITWVRRRHPVGGRDRRTVVLWR